MMWLNLSACMGAGKHFDQLLFDERYRRTSSDTADGVPPSRAAPLLLHLLMLMRLKEEVEASNDGKHGGEGWEWGGGGHSESSNWLDLDKIYECAPFLLISHVSVAVSDSLSRCAYMSITKTENTEKQNAETGRLHFLQPCAEG